MNKAQQKLLEDYVRWAFLLNRVAEEGNAEVIDLIGVRLANSALKISTSIEFKFIDEHRYYQHPYYVWKNLVDAIPKDWIGLDPMYSKKLIHSGDYWAVRNNMMHLSYRISLNALDGIRCLNVTKDGKLTFAGGVIMSKTYTKKCRVCGLIRSSEEMYCVNGCNKQEREEK